MSDEFSKLPTELKLYILRFVDSQTIRQCVSLINKEFNKLSKDYSLYQEYETAEYDVRGDKLRVELNNELYRSHLKSLSITDTGLRGNCGDDNLDLKQFKKLENLTIISDFTFSLDPEIIPENIKNIRVCGTLSTKNFTALKTIIPLLEEVDMVQIEEKNDLESKLDLQANVYLIGADLFDSDDFQNRFRRSDLSEIRSKKRFGVEGNSYTSLSARSNVLNHLAGDVVNIDLELDCSNAALRDAVSVICRECTSLRSLSLRLTQMQSLEGVSEVECTQLQTLSLSNISMHSGESLMRFRLLIQATQHDIHLQGFRPLPLLVLNFFSDTLVSSSLKCCTFSDMDVQVKELHCMRSLRLHRNINTVEVLKKLLSSTITRLDIDYGLLLWSYLNTLTVVEEVFIESAYDILQVLRALLPSKNTLRVFKCGDNECRSDESNRDILELLRQFHRMQHVELTGKGKFERKEVVDVFPAAIVTSYSKRFGYEAGRVRGLQLHTVQIFF